MGLVIEWVRRNHTSTIKEMPFEEKFRYLSWKDANDDLWTVLTDKTSEGVRRIIKTAGIGFDTVAAGYHPGVD